MPMIGWIFILAALGLVLGSLFMLRDSASKMNVPQDKLEKVRKRKAEMEAQEKKDDQW